MAQCNRLNRPFARPSHMVQKITYTGEQVAQWDFQNKGRCIVYMPDRIFRRHGRWKSTTAKDGYVEDSTDVKLSVSKSLGL